MPRNSYKCPVCGKVLVIAGPRNIELHEKSKFHMAAVDKANKDKAAGQPLESDPVKEPIKEPINEPINEIRTTTPEGKNDKKETRGRNKEQPGDSGNEPEPGTSGDSGDNSQWDGYLC